MCSANAFNILTCSFIGSYKKKVVVSFFSFFFIFIFIFYKEKVLFVVLSLLFVYKLESILI